MSEIEPGLSDLSVFHKVPWERLEGAEVKFRVVSDHVGLPSATVGTVKSQTQTIREGVIVGRGEGRGVAYDTGKKETVETNIGPAVYLATPAETILEVRTDKPENELLEFTPSENDE